MPAYEKGTPGYEIQQKKYRETMIAKFGSNEARKEYYRQIGKKGGKNGHTGGFAANPELARLAGKKGGTISRRGPASHPRKDKGIPRKHLNADSNFIEHVETKKNLEMALV